ncbi:MAG: ABC transporter ATP-binding protein, partial [Rhodoferax sp.]|uniref:ATP-binding cassette domain-containing protein n=1 Tax=Rhodoferax sp. TaxID=50421 RepID=UPI001B472857
MNQTINSSDPMLVVDDLRVSFPSRDGGWVEAVRGVSFTLGRERLGIVGESGSGKSQTGRAILGLTAPEGRVSAKTLAFNGVDLLNCSPKQRRELRGGRIAMVLQDPKFSLNPVMTIGRQIMETLLAHSRMSASAARQRALEALQSVQIDDPERVFKLYPHE